ncbi:MAG: aminopeptidase [Bacillota bacterium]
MADSKISCWARISDQEREAAFSLAEAYKEFLDRGKTERLAVAETERIAVERGFRPLHEYEVLRPGARVYAVNRQKTIILGVVGSDPFAEGLRIVGAHLDAPRLDLKPEPLYEEEGLAFFKTHYYGGIKKYHWLAIPLALYGTFLKGNGEKYELSIGDHPGEPVFTITDLLPHLAKDQIEKKLENAFPGENLNVLVGSIPLSGKENKEEQAVKKAVTEYLLRAYGLQGEDFISAEVEAVPAWPAHDVGLDRSLVGAYGQDDRACSFAALQAILSVENPRRTCLTVLVDKEEIGSTGNTGMYSRFFENTVAEILARTGKDYSELTLRRCLSASKCLSGDVNAGLDPNYAEVLDKYNAARIGCGVSLTKYTGTKGKYGTNDANAEFVYEIRDLFNRNGVLWQTGELGKVDQGGGGTIAHILAAFGMDVVDCGPPVLSMHAPFELVSKVDLYMTYRAYHAFYND